MLRSGQFAGAFTGMYPSAVIFTIAWMVTWPGQATLGGVVSGATSVEVWKSSAATRTKSAVTKLGPGASWPRAAPR